LPGPNLRFDERYEPATLQGIATASEIIAAAAAQKADLEFGAHDQFARFEQSHRRGAGGMIGQGRYDPGMDDAGKLHMTGCEHEFGFAPAFAAIDEIYAQIADKGRCEEGFFDTRTE
jgi:hypothetical protein